jgi:ribosomal protein L15
LGLIAKGAGARAGRGMAGQPHRDLAAAAAAAARAR